MICFGVRLARYATCPAVGSSWTISLPTTLIVSRSNTNAPLAFRSRFASRFYNVIHESSISKRFSDSFFENEKESSGRNENVHYEARRIFVVLLFSPLVVPN